MHSYCLTRTAILLASIALSSLLLSCSSSSMTTDLPTNEDAGTADSINTNGSNGSNDSDADSTDSSSSETNSNNNSDASSTDSASNSLLEESGLTSTADSLCEKSERRASTTSETYPYLGNIYRSETQTDERFHQLWNQVTPENAAKWNAVEAVRDVMDWSALDDAYAFARNNNYQFKLHTLIAGDNTPEWLAALSPAEQTQEITQWFDEVAARFPDLTQIDVVSEPIDSLPEYIDALGGTGETGWDWIIQAFVLARERFPSSQLLLNDYKVTSTDVGGVQFMQLATVLKQRDLIDGIGVEGHFLEDTDATTITTKLNDIAVLDLPLYLADLDLNFADDNAQLTKMKDLFPAFYEHEQLQGITLWGYRENQLWRSNAYLLRQDETDRPALDWIECYLDLAQ